MNYTSHHTKQESVSAVFVFVVPCSWSTLTTEFKWHRQREIHCCVCVGPPSRILQTAQSALAFCIAQVRSPLCIVVHRLHALRNQTKNTYMNRTQIRERLSTPKLQIDWRESRESARAKKNCIHFDLHKSSVIAAREDRRKMIVNCVQSAHCTQFDRCGDLYTSVHIE